MYVVQGITTKLKVDKTKITCYNVLDTIDGVAENVNIDLLNKNDLIFGERLPVSIGSDYGSLFYGRDYKTVGIDESKKSLVMCEVKKTWNILKKISGVVIDDAFSLHYDSDSSIIIKKNNVRGGTRICADVKDSGFGLNAVKLFLYVDDYMCYSSVYRSDIISKTAKLGVSEIEQLNFGTDIIYRIHIPLISDIDGVMYSDLYFDLDIKNETLWFRGDNPPIYLKTVNNLKRKLGGML